MCSDRDGASRGCKERVKFLQEDGIGAENRASVESRQNSADDKRKTGEGLKMGSNDQLW